MAVSSKKIIPVKYTSRDFDSIRSDLVEYAKRYYPSTYKDFSEASFGSLMLDSVGYVGDILSFYLDYHANEIFFDTALEYNNIIRHGKQRGYKFRGNPSSWGTAAFYILVPAGTSLGPNADYIPILRKGSEFATSGGSNFILNEDVIFTNPVNEVVVGRVDPTTGMPTYYVIKAEGRVLSGQIIQETVVVGAYERFLRIELGRSDIAEVLSVIDSEGHEYSEVEFLTQNVIYREIENNTDSKNYAATILKPFVVPRRFVVDREKRKTYLQFGFGSDAELTDKAVVDPTNVILQMYGKDYISDDTFDPSKLLTTETMGVAPANTTLQVTYRVNSSANVNAAVGALSRVVSAKMVFDNYSALNVGTANEVISSLEITNETPIVGDVTLPTSEELKKRIEGAFSAQARAVTIPDYRATAYGMPSKYGAIKRVAVYRDEDAFKRNLNMFVISEDESGHLTPSNQIIKENLKTWITKNKVVSDTIDIIDAKICNFHVIFEVIGAKDKNKYDVLSECIQALKEHYSLHMDIGENLYISKVYTILNKLESVEDVTNVVIKERQGGIYSDIRFNFDKQTSSDGRYIEVPKNCIMELKYDAVDLIGVIK